MGRSKRQILVEQKGLWNNQGCSWLKRLPQGEVSSVPLFVFREGGGGAVDSKQISRQDSRLRTQMERSSTWRIPSRRGAGILMCTPFLVPMTSMRVILIAEGRHGDFSPGAQLVLGDAALGGQPRLPALWPHTPLWLRAKPGAWMLLALLPDSLIL